MSTYLLIEILKISSNFIKILNLLLFTEDISIIFLHTISTAAADNTLRTTTHATYYYFKRLNTVFRL